MCQTSHIAFLAICRPIRNFDRWIDGSVGTIRSKSGTGKISGPSLCEHTSITSAAEWVSSKCTTKSPAEQDRAKQIGTNVEDTGETPA
jgi:hypothetical protein